MCREEIVDVEYAAAREEKKEKNLRGGCRGLV